MPAPTFGFELMAMAAGHGPVAGVDEVGRGPLAGPVVAAAAILDPDKIPAGIDDSKKLSPAARDRLFDEIMARAIAVGIGFGSLEEIERLNIRGASLLAMRRAVAALAIAPGHALVDGNAIPAGLPCGATAITRGDARSLSIAAASIIAKVARDRLMAQLHIAFPAYGWDRNAGYGTPGHLAALADHGPCDGHRRAFAPVRAQLLARR